jgi:biotin carboxylase
MAILVLFPNAWDLGELSRDRHRDRYDFVFEGSELFKLPGVMRLLRFDPVAMVERLAREHRGARLDGVMSSDEYAGAAMAAALARSLGLPHAEPGTILLAQHKLASRRVQQTVVPEAVPKFARVPLSTMRPERELEYPLFVKPVKGTGSILARRVDDQTELRRFLDLSPLEAFAFRRATAPFGKLARAYAGFDDGADDFIAESLVEGVQVTVDGFVHDGRAFTMGVVDSVMVPGTNAFLRFDYPSRMVPERVQTRMREVATRVVHALGMRHGQFNVELFWDPKPDRLWVIEVNPRLSYQFADLYEKVDGTSSYDVLIDLTLGRVPSFRRGAGRHAFASSFVLRAFPGDRLPPPPTAADVGAFAQRHPDMRLRIYARRGSLVETEMRATGSYCYGVLNVGAASQSDLFAAHEDARERLRFRVA